MAHRILLAAADRRAIALHQAFLAVDGYDVQTTADGFDCLARLRDATPDLLLLDIDLPWGRGEGVLALMADGDVPAVPTVLLADGSCLPRLSPVGRDTVRSYLPWPAPPHRLGETVRSVLRASAKVRPPVTAFAGEPAV